MNLDKESSTLLDAAATAYYTHRRYRPDETAHIEDCYVVARKLLAAIVQQASLEAASGKGRIETTPDA